jgi:putative acetyltransferase
MGIIKYEASHKDEYLGVWLRSTKIGHPFLTADQLAEQKEALANIYLGMAESYMMMDNNKVIATLSLFDNIIVGLFVDPPHFGKGIGRKLVEHAAELKGELLVEVFEDNVGAPDFYRKMGFMDHEEKYDDNFPGYKLLILKRTI